ncbi:hypothetical protein COOONC_24211 [Cooperia oncophora]
MKKPVALEGVIVNLIVLVDVMCRSPFQLSQGICDISFVTSPYEFFTELRDSSASPRTSQHEATSPPLITPSTSHTSSAQLPPTLTANSDHNASSSETPAGGFSNPDDGQTASSRCASIESATPPPASMDHFNTVLSTLFGKGEPAKDVRVINGPPPKATSPAPEIPGPGQIKCRLCGITVSCKKIANLTAHALKIHTPVPLWKCPKGDCEFDHADFTRVRSHIRTSHPELQGEIPRDNRNSVTVPEAQRYLAHCYPSIDWAPTSGPQQAQHRRSRKDDAQQRTTLPVWEFASTPASKKYFLWKVRVHASIKHPETPCLQMLTVASHSKPYLYIRELFPDIAALLPEDEVDEMLYGFRQLNPSVLLSVPTSLNSLSDTVADNTVADSTSCFDLKPPKVCPFSSNSDTPV